MKEFFNTPYENMSFTIDEHEFIVIAIKNN